MRYQIFSLQQSSLVELGLNVEEALLLDWILNWKDGTGMKREFIEEQQDIGYWVNYETVVKELPILFKQPTEGMSEKDLKKLMRNNKDKVGRMLKGNLSKVLTPHRMVYRGDKSKLGSMVFVVINREAIDVLKNREMNAATKTYENKKSLTCDEVKDDEVTTCDEVETNNNLENLIDDNIIHENEEKYTDNLIENKENISSKCEDDDIEAKNKRLMEQEQGNESPIEQEVIEEAEEVKIFIPSFNFNQNNDMR